MHSTFEQTEWDFHYNLSITENATSKYLTVDMFSGTVTWIIHNNRV
jgi:hypothetical protein